MYIMKKQTTLIVFAIFWMSAFSLRAGIRIGATAGVNLANAAFNPNIIKTDNFTGFQIGPIIEVSSLSGWGLDAAILYSQQGLNFKELSIEELFVSEDYKEKTSTLDIPVNLKFKLSLANMLGCYLSAGPYISFKIDDQTTFDQLKTDWGSKDFGAGLNFGAGLELFKHLQIGVNYRFALNDDYGNVVSFTDRTGNNLETVKAKTRIWSITAAFFF